MDAKAILNLFELIKDAPQENWAYNKGRLFEILIDQEQKFRDVLLVDGNITTISALTENVILTLEKMSNTNSLDEILVDPIVRNKFQEKLYLQVKEKQSFRCKIDGNPVLQTSRFQKIYE